MNVRYRILCRWASGADPDRMPPIGIIAVAIRLDSPGPFILRSSSESPMGSIRREIPLTIHVPPGRTLTRNEFLARILVALPTWIRTQVDPIRVPVDIRHHVAASITPTIPATPTTVVTDERPGHTHAVGAHALRIPVPHRPTEIDVPIPPLVAELPTLRALLRAIVPRPVQIVLSGDTETSATDCRALVEINPTPFAEGNRELGYGRFLHENAHLRYAYGSTLMARAHQLGGEELGWIANCILDRKDDQCFGAEFPGFAPLLWERLAPLGAAHRTASGARLRPKNTIDDFFLACKLRHRPRTREGRRAMRVVHRAIGRVRSGGDDEHLLEAALGVHEILRSAFDARRKSPTFGLRTRVVHVSGCESDHGTVPEHTRREFQQLIGQLLRGDRPQAYRALAAHVQNLRRSSGGITFDGAPPRVDTPADTSPETYEQARSRITSQIATLARTLQHLGRYEERFVLRGLDRGELDLHRIARIAIGAPGVYRQRVEEFVSNAEVHLVVDCSSSMGTKGMQWVHDMGVLFTEGIRTLEPRITGYTWGFHDHVIAFGRCHVNSGIAAATSGGGTNEAGALQVVGRALLRSPRAQRICIVAGDGGSNDPEAVRRIVDGLTRSGVLCIRLLVDVLTAPQVYPVEIFFSTFDEVLGELHEILRRIAKPMP